MELFVIMLYNIEKSTGQISATNNTSALQTTILDVSNLTGEYYIYIGIDSSLGNYRLLTFFDVMEYFQSKKAISFGSIPIETLIDKNISNIMS